MSNDFSPKITGWWSYDSVAVTYDRFLVPHLFAQAARDLVAGLKLAPGGEQLTLARELV